jgi:predicted deacylase
VSAERRRADGRPIEIGGHAVGPGERAAIDLPAADLYTHTEMTMPVQVINGRTAGPVLFVSAALHGDEINGVEIIRRLLRLRALRSLRGTLLAVPVVNVLGFLNMSRYLPDRRDLNRSFPGSEKGSAAARLANLFVTEIVDKADYGIDLHTGAIHRANLPQIRAQLDDERTRELATAFGVPVMINAALREGSLRELAASRGVPLLLYEAGEALRFDELAIRAGVRGIQRVMRKLGMLPARQPKRREPQPVTALESGWVRSPQSGIVHATVRLGDYVRSGDVIANVRDPIGSSDTVIRAVDDGVVIGLSRLPLAHEGDAIVHVAAFDQPTRVARSVEEFHRGHRDSESEVR